MNITLVNERNKGDILRFLEKIDHGELKQSLSYRSNKGIYSFHLNDQIIAVASCFTSTWHPTCLYVRMAYDEKLTDVEGMKNMMSLLRAESDQPLFFLLSRERLLLIKALSSDDDFECIRKTEIVAFVPALYEQEEDPAILDVARIKQDADLYQQFLTLCKQSYTDTHRVNPVGEFPLKKWEEVIFEDLVEQASLVYVKDGK